MDPINLILVIIGGFGAGLATGLFGASAATVLAAFLIVFVGFDPYTAIGLSLAVDVAASLAVAKIYKKYDNVKVKPALLMLGFVVLGVFFGSLFSVSIPPTTLAGITGIAVSMIGSGFIISRNSKRMESCNNSGISCGKIKKNLLVAVSGLAAGIIAGVFGGGAGLSMFAALFFLLGYSLHEAIGTSVFIMIFIALLGTGTHYYFQSFDLWVVFWGSLGAIAGGAISAFIANKVSEKLLRISIGLTLLLLGLILCFRAFI